MAGGIPLEDITAVHDVLAGFVPGARAPSEPLPGR